MSKWVKMAIVSALLICVAMIYIGKNVLFGTDGNESNGSSQAKSTEQKAEEQGKGDTSGALPMLLELKTST